MESKLTRAKRLFLLKNVTSDDIPSGIFLSSTRLFEKIQGTDGCKTLTTELFRSRYAELNRNVLDEGIKKTVFPTLSNVETVCEEYISKGIVPLVLCCFNYHAPNLDWLHSPAKVERPEGVTSSLLDRKETMFAGVLTPRRIGYALQREESFFRGLNVPFRISRNLFFSNINHIPDEIQIDFGDGKGSRMVSWEEDIIVEYSKAGRYTITIEIPSSKDDGRKIARTSLAVELEQKDYSEKWDLSGTFTPKGHTPITTHGTASIYYPTQGKPYNNVVLIADGFNTGDSRLYDDLQKFSFMDKVLDGGYTVILLKYDDATTYIQVNAMMAISAIEKVNSKSDELKNFFCAGVSMGGLVIRYALTYMESGKYTGTPHNATAYISFDTPHQGAAIPLGAQHHIRAAVHYDLINDDLDDLIDVFASVAVKQMLRFYVDSDTEIDGETYEPAINSYRSDFLDDLKDIGQYPQIRECAISDGNTKGNCVTPASIKTVKWGAACGTGGCTRSSPDNDQGKKCVSSFIDAGSDWNAFWGDHATLHAEGSDTIGYDSAPGGMADWWKQLADALDSSSQVEEAVAVYDNACFVSTVSALDVLTLEDNPCSPVGGESVTNFASSFACVANRSHATLTYAIANYLLMELNVFRPEKGIQYPITASHTITSDGGYETTDQTVKIDSILPAGKQPTNVWVALSGFKFEFKSGDNKEHPIHILQCTCSAELKSLTEITLHWDVDIEDHNADDDWDGILEALVFVECGQ